MGSLPTGEQEVDSRHHDITTVLGVSILPQSELSEQPLTLSAVMMIFEAVRTAIKQRANLIIGIAGASHVGGGKVTVSHALGGGHGVCSRISGSKDVIDQRVSRLRLLVSAVLEALVIPHLPSDCNVSVEPIDYDPSTNLRYQKVFSDVSGLIRNPDVYFLKRFCPCNQLEKIVKAGGGGSGVQELINYAIWEVSNLIYDATRRPPRHFASHPGEQEFAALTQTLIEIILCRLVDTAVQKVDENSPHQQQAISCLAKESFTDSDMEEYETLISVRREEQTKKPKVKIEIPTLDEFKYSQLIRKLVPYIFNTASEVIGLLNFTEDDVLKKLAERLRVFVPPDELALYNGIDFAFHPLSPGCGIYSGEKDAPYDLTSGSKLSAGANFRTNEVFVGDDGFRDILFKFWFYVHPIADATRLMMAHVFNRNFERLGSLNAQEDRSGSKTAIRRNDPVWTASKFLYADGMRSFDDIPPDVVANLSDGMSCGLSNIARYVIDRYIRVLRHLVNDKAVSIEQCEAYNSDHGGDALFELARLMSSHAIESCSHIPADWDGKNLDLWQNVCTISLGTQNVFRSNVMEHRTHARLYIRRVIRTVLHLRERIAGALDGYIDQHGKYMASDEKNYVPTVHHFGDVLREISPEKLKHAEIERKLDPHESLKRGRNVAIRVRRAKRVLRLRNACEILGLVPDPLSSEGGMVAKSDGGPEIPRDVRDKAMSVVLSFAISEKLDQADEIFSLDPTVPGNEEKIIGAVEFILEVLRGNILVPVMDSFKQKGSERNV